MQFTSYIFIMLFMPVLMTGYFLLNRIGREKEGADDAMHTEWAGWLKRDAGRIFLIIGGAAFFLYGNLKQGGIFAISIFGTLLFALLIERSVGRKKVFLALSVVFQILLLGYFKYTNFIIDNVNSVFGRSFSERNILLPVGISFYTFQQIMYLVQVYEGKIAKISVTDYLSYILYFPKLWMGPLAEPDDLIRQLKDPSRKKINLDHMAQGLKLFSFGFFKKMLLADTLAIAVSWGFGAPDGTTAADWLLIMLCYTFEIYFDFSGYCDMGFGISRMLNIDLPVNFDSPYRADSIRDFWKRWHITLNGFFVKHIYIPLGGSRKGRVRTCLNIMIIFLISGLWHGANRSFILWGAIHGLLCVFDHLVDRHYEKFLKKAAGKVFKGIRWLLTFGAVNALWLLFRSENIHLWLRIGKTILKGLLRGEGMRISEGLLDAFRLPEQGLLTGVFHADTLLSGLRGSEMLLFLIASFGICLIPKNNIRNKEKLTIPGLVVSVIAFVWAFLCLGTEAVFVYQGF
ncbi:MAG: MBOAT family protein [Lachnospiraceae bacterium]|nr:MBOAT family protein [Lachnospiraceae bacterium]